MQVSPYFIIPAAQMLLGILIYTFPAAAQRRFISVAYVLFLALVIAFRPLDIGVDTKTYLEILRNVDDYVFVNEPGFIFVTKIIQLLGLPNELYLLILALFILLPSYFAFSNIFGRLGFIVFTALACTHVFWLSNFQLVRNGIAVSLFMVAVSHGVAGRKKIDYIFLLLATSFHFVAVIPSFIYLVAKHGVKIVSGTRNLLLLAIMALVFFLFFDAYFSGWVEKYFWYNSLASEGALTEAGWFKPYYVVSLVPVFVYAFMRRKLDPQEGFLFKIYFFLLVAALFIFGQNPLYKDRIYLFAAFLEPAVVLICFRRMNIFFNPALAFIVFYLMVAIFVMFFWWPRNFY